MTTEFLKGKVLTIQFPLMLSVSYLVAIGQLVCIEQKSPVLELPAILYITSLIFSLLCRLVVCNHKCMELPAYSNQSLSV